jgi:hypothetical protein
VGDELDHGGHVGHCRNDEVTPVGARQKAMTSVGDVFSLRSPTTVPRGDPVKGRSDDRAFYFLGPATYVKHESELPMAITWCLHHPLPGDLFAAFAVAVA